MTVKIQIPLARKDVAHLNGLNALEDEIVSDDSGWEAIGVVRLRRRERIKSDVDHRVHPLVEIVQIEVLKGADAVDGELALNRANKARNHTVAIHHAEPGTSLWDNGDYPDDDPDAGYSEDDEPDEHSNLETVDLPEDDVETRGNGHAQRAGGADDAQVRHDPGEVAHRRLRVVPTP